ncbi:SLC5/6 family protein [Phyllobacterium sp. K27]
MLHGVEFIGLYVGILLIFTIGFPFLLKLRQLARSEGITSISDMIGARYGKSFLVAAIVTSITTVGLIPYFALQMSSIHYLFDVLAGAYTPQMDQEHTGHLAIPFLSIGLVAAFIVFYSGRSNPSAERYNGIVHSLALDTVIKYVAILSIGMATATWLFGSPSDIFDIVSTNQDQIAALEPDFSIGDFVSLIVVGMFSIFLLPSQFHLIIVQNRNDSELRMARWFIPATMLVLGIFIFSDSDCRLDCSSGRCSSRFLFSGVACCRRTILVSNSRSCRGIGCSGDDNAVSFDIAIRHDFK